MIDDLSWLAGGWETKDESGRRTDEHWSGPAGGSMLGMSRTVKAGALAEFEYLRIVEKDGAIVYIAHPGGRAPGTEFRMTSLRSTEAPNGGGSEIRALFENPEHDFPKRILYVRRADGGLVAIVDAGEGTRAITYEYRPMGAGAPPNPESLRLREASQGLIR